MKAKLFKTKKLAEKYISENYPPPSGHGRLHPPQFLYHGGVKL